MIQRIKQYIWGELGGRFWLKIQIVRIFTSLLPLNKHKYLCISMSGNNYGCNVRAFAEYVSSVEPNADIIWAFSPIMYSSCSFVHKVRLYSFQYYWHLFTSKYIVSNHRLNKFSYPYKRKGQLYLQTWHGTAMKRIEADVETSLQEEYSRTAQWDSKKIDVFISGSHFMTGIYQSVFWYDGKVDETGTPRNDIFFTSNSDVKQRVRKALRLNDGEKILLYAPTFRQDYSLKHYNIDAQSFLDEIHKKWGGTWRLVLRLHPNLLMSDPFKKINSMFPTAIDATLYPDMQELLYIADVLVTDYSASMFDFMYTKRPCFLYIPDYKSYERGFYWKLSDLPFPSFSRNDEIKGVLAAFNEERYQKNIEGFLLRIGDCETGNASKNVYRILHS